MSKKHAPSHIPSPTLPYGALAIQEALLEPWPNPAPEETYETNISYPEFTCLCPRSGYPDFATILIRYRPAKKIVELKSLKLYLNSFRDRAISHEAVTALIYRDLMTLLDPHFLEVKGDFNVRGNVKTVITIDSEMEKSAGKSPKKRLEKKKQDD
ncbi:MAG: preQ(1) synthase [Leptospirillum sp.]|jgi:7-cyano-7-deazaguanine reductase